MQNGTDTWEDTLAILTELTFCCKHSTPKYLPQRNENLCLYKNLCKCLGVVLFIIIKTVLHLVNRSIKLGIFIQWIIIQQ